MSDGRFERRLAICLRGIRRRNDDRCAAYQLARNRAYGIARGGAGSEFDMAFFEAAERAIAEYVGYRSEPTYAE